MMNIVSGSGSNVFVFDPQLSDLYPLHYQHH